MDVVGTITSLLELIGPSISKCYTDHRSFRENLENLKRSLQELNNLKEQAKLQLNMQLQPGKMQRSKVKSWLKNVEEINVEAQTIIRKVERVSHFCRAHASKRILKQQRKVEKLLAKDDFPHGLVDDAQDYGFKLSARAIACEPTATRSKEEILKCILSDDITKIGVYGMGGIGKTTIMAHINNKLVKLKDMFDYVIWVTVSREFDVDKLQRSIAKALKLDLSIHEDVKVRAGILSTTLKEKQRWVIILDDLWEGFSLEEEVRIPKCIPVGCKLVLTTRLLDICRRMDCKPIPVDLLSKEESEKLFFHIVDLNFSLFPGLESTVKEVIKRCACLPLAIVAIAGSMKGIVDLAEWRTALEDLKASRSLSIQDSEADFYEKLKFSYDRLKYSSLQECLLYCALYPEDWEIDRREIIRHMIAQDLVKVSNNKWQAKLDKAHTMLNKLESACLLQSCEDYVSQSVKMHDSIRYMALKILNAKSQVMVKTGVGMREAPVEEEWPENIEKVSLIGNRISSMPSNLSPQCYKMSTLLLARLTELKMLDLQKSDIIEVPHGIEKLVNLQYLNLSSDSLEMLPCGILPHLSNLRCLILPIGYHATATVKVEELTTLKRLESVVYKLHDLRDFNMFVTSLAKHEEEHKIQKYHLAVGGSELEVHMFSRDFKTSVRIVECNICSVDGETLILPNDLEELAIGWCHDVKCLSEDIPSFNDAKDLSLCEINWCDGIEHVFGSFTHNCKSLHTLGLYYLPNLEGIFKGELFTLNNPIPSEIFSKLDSIDIRRCPKIKKLFDPELVVQHLRNLRDICVISCEQMVEILGSTNAKEVENISRNNSSTRNNRSSPYGNIDAIVFKRLRNIGLVDLPELKSICGKPMVCDSLEYLTVEDCPKLKKIPLVLRMSENEQLSPPPSLNYIMAEKEWWEAVEFEQPNAKTVLQSFVKGRY